MVLALIVAVTNAENMVGDAEKDGGRSVLNRLTIVK